MAASASGGTHARCCARGSGWKARNGEARHCAVGWKWPRPAPRKRTPIPANQARLGLGDRSGRRAWRLKSGRAPRRHEIGAPCRHQDRAMEAGPASHSTAPGNASAPRSGVADQAQQGPLAHESGRPRPAFLTPKASGRLAAGVSERGGGGETPSDPRRNWELPRGTEQLAEGWLSQPGRSGTATQPQHVTIPHSEGCDVTIPTWRKPQYIVRP